MEYLVLGVIGLLIVLSIVGSVIELSKLGDVPDLNYEVLNKAAKFQTVKQYDGILL